MSDVACPNCRGVMSSPPELSGKWVACPFCHQQFVLPNEKIVVAPAMATTNSGTLIYSGQTATGFAPAAHQPSSVEIINGIRTPILISAIFNTIGAVLYTAFCITFFIGIPLGILCIFEYCYFSNSLRMPARQAVREGRTIAIYEIVAGALTLNVIVLVCGILALVMANQADERISRTPGVY